MGDFRQFLTTKEGLTVLSKDYKQMKRDIKIFMNKKLTAQIEQSAIDQIVQVNSFDNCIATAGLPDFHTGYGFPIGTVSAFRNTILPFGVGYDINCGVRAISTTLELSDINTESLADNLAEIIPSGMHDKSMKGERAIGMSELKSIMELGATFCAAEADRIESGGKFAADPKCVSQKARDRGLNTFGSLGSGNHYLEVQYVDTIFDKCAAEAMNIRRRGQIVIMIHTGSRKFGHQVCTDYLKLIGSNQLSELDIKSELGVKYLGAMGCAANYAFANRQFLANRVAALLKASYRAESHLIYDVCHNIAKQETFAYDGILENLVIHRKGASEALPPSHPRCPDRYTDFGQPIPVGGSMGTNSYIVCAQENVMKYTFASACHGAGRCVSRRDSARQFNSDDVRGVLDAKGVMLRCKNQKELVEEAPMCYKDIDLVIESSELAGLTKKVCKTTPLIVIKG